MKLKDQVEICLSNSAPYFLLASLDFTNGLLLFFCLGFKVFFFFHLPVMILIKHVSTKIQNETGNTPLTKKAESRAR